MSNFYIENSERLPNPSIDISILASAYVIVTFLMTLLYTNLKKSRSPLADGLLLGLITGLLWSLPGPLVDVAYGVGVSPAGIFVDSGWQMIEEAVGGLVMAWSYQYLTMRSKTKNIIFNPPL
jgi:predicted permease